MSEVNEVGVNTTLSHKCLQSPFKCVLPAVAMKCILTSCVFFIKEIPQMWAVLPCSMIWWLRSHAFKTSFCQNDYHRSTAPFSSPLHNKRATARMQSSGVFHNHDLLSLMSLSLFLAFIHITKCVNQVHMLRHALFDSPCTMLTSSHGCNGTHRGPATQDLCIEFHTYNPI